MIDNDPEDVGLRNQLVKARAIQEMAGGKLLADGTLMERLVYWIQIWWWYRLQGRKIQSRLATMDNRHIPWFHGMTTQELLDAFVKTDNEVLDLQLELMRLKKSQIASAG